MSCFYFIVSHSGFSSSSLLGFLFVGAHTYMYTCMCIYIHMHIHMYTHIKLVWVSIHKSQETHHSLVYQRIFLTGRGRVVYAANIIPIQLSQFFVSTEFSLSLRPFSWINQRVTQILFLSFSWHFNAKQQLPWTFPESWRVTKDSHILQIHYQIPVSVGRHLNSVLVCVLSS